MRIRPWLITSVRTTVVIMLWIMIPKQAKCVRDKQRRDMRTNPPGLADRPGLCTDILLVTDTLKIRSISTRRKKYITSSLRIRTCRKISFLTGIMMLRTSRMNRVMLLPLLVRLLPFTNWTVICRAIITRKLLIRSWKAWAHPLIVLKLEQMETLS